MRRSAAPTRTTSMASISLPYLTGKEKESPRKLFVYISDDGDVLGVRYDNWKVVFMEQRCQGRWKSGSSRSPGLRMPKSSICGPIRTSAPTSPRIPTGMVPRHVPMSVRCAGDMAQWAATFKDFPPIQKPNTFTIDEALRMMHETIGGYTERWFFTRATGLIAPSTPAVMASSGPRGHDDRPRRLVLHPGVVTSPPNRVCGMAFSGWI